MLLKKNQYKQKRAQGKKAMSDDAYEVGIRTRLFLVAATTVYC